MNKKEITYLYLDDNDKVTRDGDVELLNATSTRINIITDYPCSWAQRVRQILSDINAIDGLILDWELTNKSESAKLGTQQAEDVDFSAESLAEHLRVSVIQHGSKDLPIILCSADKNKTFTQLRSKELTSKDLFDLTYIKNDLFVHQVSKSEAQLYDLAITYKQLQNTRLKLEDVLSIATEELASIDIRFIDALETIVRSKTTHDVIQFMLKYLIEKEGVLINEDVLAARLGVDREASKESWITLKQILHEHIINYKGFLSIGWENYWAFKVESFWLNNISSEDLRTTGATKRVELLNKKLQLNLVAATKIKYCSSEEFWTVCYGTKKPLDPSNGFMIGDNMRNPWLEIQYVSGFAELEKPIESAWRINVMDRDRFNHFKSLITRR